MTELFDLAKFDSYKEDNRREVKKAEGGLPNSLWETYSAFANCYGGVIILGVKENKDGSWQTTGLKDASRLKKAFWDTINNRKKISFNLLRDDDVETYTIEDTGDVIMVIWVPIAKREQKPIYINDDLFGGTFRRNWEGDYHCARLQVKTMLRDQAEETMDMEVLDEAEISDLNKDSIRGYRNSHKSFKPGHPFERLDDSEYLRAIGAAAISGEDKKLHPTAAGMLMFGMEGGFRIDDTPVHRALREALANCIINTDFYGKYGVIIIKDGDTLILENPGYIRLGKEQMRKGGKSDPRNKNLMKMFNMIDIGEHAGSGVPNIFNVWEDEGWEEPIIEESFNPDRTSLTLRFTKKQAIKNKGLKPVKIWKESDYICKIMKLPKQVTLQNCLV